MHISWLLLIGLLNFQETPFKPDSEFTIKLDLSFKQRPPASNYSMNFDETHREREKMTRPGPTPYIVLHISIDSVATNEIKLKVFQSSQKMVYSKKVSKGMEFKLDIGYSDDITDQMAGHFHQVIFYDAKRKEVSRVTINFDTEGNYFVNEKRYGKI